jgi:hypothetical protein
MSNKKSLLTESEVRRFMALANIPVLNENMYGEGGGASPQDPRRPETVRPGDEPRMAEAMPSMEEEDEMGGEEMPPEAGAGDEEAEAKLMSVLEDFAQKVKAKLGIDLEIGGEEGGVDGMDLEVSDGGGEEEEEEEEEEEMEEPAAEEPAAEEEADEEEGEEELDEAEEVEEDNKLEESKLVDVVLNRVTARLIAEAKKKKMTAAEKKKKEEEAKKKKEAMKKKAAAAKKKLEEANAPAPKSTMPNASAAGVAKGHGPGSKAFGTDEKKSMKWKKGKGEKGHELETVSASAEHIVSHGKKNLAVQGGNKKG